MKKVILSLVAVVAIALTSFGQSQAWENKTYVDEFGDPTADKFSRVIVEGTFSNSATISSELLVSIKMSTSEGAIAVSLDFYEYGSSKANFSSEFGVLLIKGDAGDVHKLRVYQGKSGYIYFGADEVTTKQFIELLSTNNSLKCSYTEVTEYGTPSKYRFSIMVTGTEKSIEYLNNK